MMLVALWDMLSKPIMVLHISKAEGTITQVIVPTDYLEGKLLLYDATAGVAMPAEISLRPPNLSFFFRSPGIGALAYLNSYHGRCCAG